VFHQHRRSFLKRAAAGGIAATFAISGTRASGRVLGANDRVRIALAGIHGRGQAHITGLWRDAGRGDRLLGRSRQPAVRVSKRRSTATGWQHAAVRPGPAPRARRPDTRRRLDRHTQPLARAVDHLGLPGGQGRACRETVQSHDRRRPKNGRSRAEIRPHRPARHATAIRSADSSS
jgi:hypothetical protein